MNCEEFSQKLDEDPFSNEPGFIEHARSCKQCNKRYLQQLDLDRRLSEAIKQENSGNLKQKIVAAYAQQQTDRKKKFFRSGWFVAMAAMTFVAFLGVKMYQNFSLNNFVLAHIDHEIEHLQDTGRVDSAHLDDFYQAFDSEFLKLLPDVVYVEKCWMRTGFGLHLIVSGKQGPVTVLLMPNEMVEMVQAVKSTTFTGKVFPLGQGSIALVGYPGESIDMLAEKLRMARKAG